jgi:hypothetical protein
MKDYPTVSFRNQPPYSGYLRLSQLPIGRTLALELIKAGYLKSIIIGMPGTKRGVRLVEVASLTEYLASLPKSLPRIGGPIKKKKASGEEAKV